MSLAGSCSRAAKTQPKFMARVDPTRLPPGTAQRAILGNGSVANGESKEPSGTHRRRTAGFEPVSGGASVMGRGGLPALRVPQRPRTPRNRSCARNRLKIGGPAVACVRLVPWLHVSRLRRYEFGCLGVSRFPVILLRRACASSSTNPIPSHHLHPLC